MPKQPYLVADGDKIHLRDLPTRDDALFDGDKEAGLVLLDELSREIAELQDKLFADNRYRLLVVLQGMDGAGKSSTIRDVFRYTNSLGVHARSFGKPSDEELERDYMWRIHAHTPRRGEIVVFDRSHYEDVTTVKVLGLRPDKAVNRRMRHIVEFERMLADEGTEVVKFFLHLSKEEQAEQLRERLEDRVKAYKFNPADLEARASWEAYQDVWSEAISATSTDRAPWHVIPADRRWYRKLAIATAIRDRLAGLDLEWPKLKASADDIAVWRDAL